MAPPPASIADKLDRVIDTTTDTRLAVATIAGELREIARRMDEHERWRSDVEQRVRLLERAAATNDQSQAHDQDVEQRIRSLEKFRYAVPSAAAVVSIASLLVAIWGLFGR